MITRVKEITEEGVLLSWPHNGQEEEVWLPAEEWGDQYIDWPTAYRTLRPGDSVCARVLPAGNEVAGRRTVTRRHLELGDIAPAQQPVSMEVVDVSRTIIRGHIGHMPAVAPLKTYVDWYEKRISDNLRDHAAVGKGDVLGGIVLAMDERYRAVDLDLGAYLALRAEEVEAAWRAARQHVGLTATMSSAPSFKSPVLTLPADVVAEASPALVLEDHPEDQELIARYLRQNGIVTETASKPHDVIVTELERFRLVVVDINLDGTETSNDGFTIIERLQSSKQVRILLVTGEQIGSEKLRKWGHLQVHACLGKPLGMERLCEAIQEAVGSAPSPWSSWVESIQPEGQMVLDPVETSPLPDASALSVEDAVRLLSSKCDGVTVHVFRLHPRSLRARSIASAGLPSLRWERLAGKIGKSPIKDAALLRDRFILAHQAPRVRRHLWTRKMMDYESFLGFPVRGPESYVYALVAFHPRKDAFSSDFVNAAQLCAEQVGRSLDLERLRETRENEATDAATGLALQVLAHEFRNEIDPARERARRLGALVSADAAPEGWREDSLNLVAELFDWFTRAEDKIAALSGVRIARRTVGLHDCIREAARACRNVIQEHESFDGPSRHIFIEDLPASSEAFAVRAPRAALVIVFFNLFLNAAQQISLMTNLRSPGLISWTCERRIHDSGKAIAVVQICDTGPGIHRDDWERVFQPGYSTKPGGSGLGLGICRRLLKEISEGGLRGDVHITRSVVWDGTTFTVTLPLVD